MVGWKSITNSWKNLFYLKHCLHFVPAFSQKHSVFKTHYISKNSLEKSIDVKTIFLRQTLITTTKVSKGRHKLVKLKDTEMLVYVHHTIERNIAKAKSDKGWSSAASIREPHVKPRFVRDYRCIACIVMFTTSFGHYLYFSSVFVNVIRALTKYHIKQTSVDKQTVVLSLTPLNMKVKNIDSSETKFLKFIFWSRGSI